jgi:hypothetical protein
MSVVGVVLICWLALAAIAFLGLSALARLSERRDADADLGIVGEAELRMLLSEEDFTILDSRRLHSVSLR